MSFRSLGNSRTFLTLIFAPLIIVSVLGKLFLVDRTLFSLFDHFMLLVPEVCLYLFLIIVLDKVAILFNENASRWKRSLPVILAYTVFINFLILETVGLAYRIVTGGHDFDYSLIFHTIGNIQDLWPVFEAEFGANMLRLIVAGCVLSLIGLFFPVRHAVKRTNRNSLEGMYTATLIGLLLAYGATERWNEFPVRPGKPVIRENPKPISYLAIERSLKKSWLKAIAKDAQPIRQGYSKEPIVKWAEHGISKKYNVAIVVMESTGRSQATLGQEKIMPFLEGVADEGTEFLNAQTFMSHTSKSLVSIMCGVEPSLNMPILAGKLSNGIIAKCLPEILGDLGYETAYFSPVLGSFEHRRKFVQNAGFSEQFLKEDISLTGYEEVSFFGYEEDVLLTPIDAWLSERGKEPFLFSILSLMPHHPYVVPSDFDKQYFSENAELDGHINALRYQDQFLKKLFDRFQKNKVLEDTIFIIVGDHGEAFGEHGINQHDTVPYNEVLNVPMVIYGPNVTKGVTVSTPVSLLDVLPTSLKLVGATIESGGEGYAGKDAFVRTPDDEIFSYCYRDKYCGTLRIGDWKYIHYFGFKEDELFNLSQDWNERLSLVTEHPEKALTMKEKYISYIRELEVYQSNYFGETSQWMKLR